MWAKRGKIQRRERRERRLYEMSVVLVHLYIIDFQMTTLVTTLFIVIIRKKERHLLMRHVINITFV